MISSFRNCPGNTKILRNGSDQDQVDQNLPGILIYCKKKVTLLTVKGPPSFYRPAKKKPMTLSILQEILQGQNHFKIIVHPLISGFY